MHWSERTELLWLALMLNAIPFSSGVSVAFAYIWMLNVFVKNTLLKRWSFFDWHQDKKGHYSRICYMLLPMICYWIAYLVSMFWTENISYGLLEINSNVWMLFFPLVFALTDFRQLTSEWLRSFFWLFVCILSVLFVGCFVNVLVSYKIAYGSFVWYLMSRQFYFIHHSYMALYILTGLAFLYSEWGRQEKHGKWQVILTMVCTCCLILFLLCINSRAGLLCLIVLMALCWIHQCFVRKNFRFAWISLVVVTLLVAVSHFAMPEHFRRLSATIEQVAQGDKSDGRFEIMGNAWMVVKDNMLWGVGAGDRMDELVPYYGSMEDTYCPHNQYLDTWMATGFPGLLSLLAILVLPLAMAWRKRLIFPFLFVIMLGLNLMFESMLERQMGIVFVALMYVLMALFFSMESSDKKYIKS